MQEQNSEIVHQQQQVIKLTQNKQIDIPSDHKVEQTKLHEHEEEGQHNEVQAENKKDQIQENAADIKDHNQNTKISGVNKEASLKQEQPGQVQQLKQSIKADQDANLKNEDQIEKSKQQKDQSKQETKQNADTATLIQRIDHKDDVENIKQPTPTPQVDVQEKAGEQKTTAQQNNIQTKLGEANQQGNEQVQEEKPVQNINKQKEDEKLQGNITVPKELQTKLKQNKDEIKRQDQCKQYKDEIAEKDPYKKEDVYKGEDKKQKIEEVQLQQNRQQAVKSTEKKQLKQEQAQQQNKEKQGGQGGQAREDQLKLEKDKDKEKEEQSKQEKQSEEEQQQQVATQSKEAGEQKKGEQNKQQTLQYKKQEQIGEEYEANKEKQSKQIKKNVNEQNNQKQCQGIKQQQSMNKDYKEQEYKEQEQNRKSKKPNLMPIVLTEQNEPYTSITPKQLQHKQIIQFEQYKPILSTRKSQHIDHDIDNHDNSKSKTVEVDSKIKQQQNQKNSKNNYIKKEYLATQYQGIQNQTLLKRIQQLEETVKQLKAHKQVEKEDNTASQTVEKQKQKEKDEKKEKKEKKKNRDQIIHDASVHGLVSQLAKTETENTGNLIKKPALHQKRYKRRKLDLSNLMDKNMTHASNLFNVTIGQILNPNSKHEQQKQALRKQIKTLRQKVLLLQQDKRALSTQRPGIDTRRQTASTGKKQICGKLVKISQLKASRVSGFEQNDSVFKTEINKEYQKIQTKSQRDSFVDGLTLKNKVSSNSATQRQKRQSDKQKDNPNNMSFRVRRPTAKSSNFPNQQDHSRLNLMNEQQQKINIIPVSTQDISHKKKVEKTHWWQQPFITSISMPQMPSPPSQFDSQQDLYTLGKLTFMAFGVDVDGAKQMNVKKYKNCVYFNIGEKNNILWYFDGRFYFGEWQIHLTGEGEKSGQGFQLVPGKFVYQGLFKEGKRNGIGKIKILNKQKNVLYEGNWVDGNKCGEGKQIDEYGIKYWGEWKDNKRDGFGRLKLQDGDYYEGYFQKGIKTGEGTEYFKNGDKYQGNYLANKFHGKGKYIWKNGSIYEGQFNHGIRSGQGKWKSNQTTDEFDSYQGQYEGDKKNGYGKYKWADGSQYEGFFKDDLKQGQGTIRYKNGKVAKLLWRNGQPMKKLFSQQQQKYRQTQKSKQKERTNEKQSKFNKTDSISSQQFSIGRDD